MQPILFQLGRVTVYSYGLMIALGFIALVVLGRKLAPRIGVDPEGIVDLAMVAIVGGMFGAYINYLVSYDWARIAGNPLEIFRIWDGGLVFLGGLIGGVISAIIFMHIKKMPLWDVADLAAILIPVGYGFGRLGCFLAGCCHGHQTSLAWGVIFPGFSVPRHPTQLYSFALAVVLFVFALWFFKHRRFKGQSFVIYLLAYGSGRFLIELLRENPTVFGWVTVAQFTGMVMIAAALVLYPILKKRFPLKTQ